MKGAQKMTFRDFTSVVDYRTREANGGPSRVDPSPFAGTWVNTNDSAPHRIAKLVMTVRDGVLMSGRSDYYTREFFYQIDDDSF